jgi:hypothetical protein
MVQSNDHAFGPNYLGTYFNYYNADVSFALGGKSVASWKDGHYLVKNLRTGKTATVVMWSTPNGGSKGEGHGRYTSGASKGQWQTGDRVVFVTTAAPTDSPTPAPTPAPTEAPFQCYDTRQRGALRWISKGRTTSFETALTWCKNYNYVSLECPNANGFEVWCVADAGNAIIHKDNCKGAPHHAQQLNGGQNAHCVGPYKWDGFFGGGWHRGAMYKVPSAPKPYQCYDTRQRGALSWKAKGRTTSFETAKAWCSGYEYVSLECPNANGFEVWCVNNKGNAIIHKDNCAGVPRHAQQLNGGQNAHCVGPYKWDGFFGGGWHRGAMYELK